MKYESIELDKYTKSLILPPCGYEQQQITVYTTDSHSTLLIKHPHMYVSIKSLQGNFVYAYNEITINDAGSTVTLFNDKHSYNWEIILTNPGASITFV